MDKEWLISAACQRENFKLQLAAGLHLFGLETLE
jgi:hypothetical protein